MTVTIKVMIPAKQAENVQTTQYTAVNCKAIIDKFTATNTTAGNVTISVNLVTAAGTAGCGAGAEGAAGIGGVGAGGADGLDPRGVATADGAGGFGAAMGAFAPAGAFAAAGRAAGAAAPPSTIISRFFSTVFRPMPCTWASCSALRNGPLALR